MGAPAYVLGRRLEHTINVSAADCRGQARWWPPTRRSYASSGPPHLDGPSARDQADGMLAWPPRVTH
jgi:hypothetical protein